ncbi:cytochrome P450 [Umbelopsis sp. AD052]|nr:cytochrome P450 [Umbelopsis sp. AD052]
MESQLIKIIDRLPDGVVRQFLKRNAKYSSAVAILVAGYFVTSRLYRVYFGPLSKIPGTFFDTFFDMPFLYYNLPLGTRYKRMIGLHQKYGRVVRTTGHTITISDKDMIKQVLHDDDLPKAWAYKNLQLEGHQTMFNTLDKDFHKTRRRVVSPAFSVKYLAALEHLISDSVGEFVQHINSAVDTAHLHNQPSAEVDMWRLLQFTALDVIGATAFDQSFNMVKDGSHPLPATITRNLTNAAFTGAFMVGIIEERLKSGKRKNDILQILIDSQNAELKNDRLNNEDIVHENILFLIAGSETTSNTIGFAIIHLLEHPEALALLREELDSVYPRNGSNVRFEHEDLKNLPYLNAVINETMRIKPVAMGGLPRETDRDYILGGKYHIPKNIMISADIYACQVDPEYWPEPLAFKPERWLEGSEIPADKDAFFPFSSGSRNCIGKNFAWMEMRLLLSSFVYNFNFDPVPESVEDAKDLRQFITYTIASNSYKVKVTKRH